MSIPDSIYLALEGQHIVGAFRDERHAIQVLTDTVKRRFDGIAVATPKWDPVGGVFTFSTGASTVSYAATVTKVSVK